MVEVMSETSTRAMRLPQSMINECKAQAREGERWGDVLRRKADKAAANNTKVEPGDDPDPLIGSSTTLAAKTMRYLDKEARRLTRTTGRTWSAAGVLRALWAETPDNRED